MEAASASLSAISQKWEQLQLEEVSAEAETIRSVRDAQIASEEADFKPFDGFLNGPPNPPCAELRIQTAAGVHRTLELEDGEIESTLRLCCKVFDVETATVSLLTGEKIYLVGACGALPVCVCPDRWGFCGWSFLNTTHELNVVEDMEKDMRFSQNYFVVSPTFKLVFYVMAPLVASNGSRIGTLCIMGQQPRKFDCSRGTILANLAELLVRQIEERWVREAAMKVGAEQLMRAAEAYTSAVGFVDTSEPGCWRMLHLNKAAIKLLGCDWNASYAELAKLDEGRHVAEWKGVPVSEFLELDPTQAIWDGTAGVQLLLSKVKGAKGTAAQGKLFNITCRLAAAAEALDEYTPFSIGVPSFVLVADPQDALSRTYFFMHIRQVEREAPKHAASALMLYGPRNQDAYPIPGLVLGPLLGRGSFGKVFRGVYNGKPVAVKIMERLEDVRREPDGTPVEVALTSGLRHTGVMRTFAWALKKAEPAAAARARRSVDSYRAGPTCWLVTEYCDKGTLADAIVKGWMRTSVLPTVGGTNLRTVAITAYEIASAMAYMHKQKVLHLDLSSNNIMLATFAANPHGFQALVGDFGLSRSAASLRERAQPASYGTVTYMAPETISGGLLDTTCDVYAFGVLLWEMLTSSRAWANCTHYQVVHYVGTGCKRLCAVAGLPGPLAELLEGCLQHDPEKRLTFTQVVSLLEVYLQSTRDNSIEEMMLPLRSNAPLE